MLIVLSEPNPLTSLVEVDARPKVKSARKWWHRCVRHSVQRPCSAEDLKRFPLVFNMTVSHFGVPNVVERSHRVVVRIPSFVTAKTVTDQLQNRQLRGQWETAVGRFPPYKQVLCSVDEHRDVVRTKLPDS